MSIIDYRGHGIIRRVLQVSGERNSIIGIDKNSILKFRNFRRKRKEKDPRFSLRETEEERDGDRGVGLSRDLKRSRLLSGYSPEYTDFGLSRNKNVDGEKGGLRNVAEK